MQKLLAGAVGGTLAAAPMAVAMKAIQRSSPSARRQMLPPRQITMELARRIGLAPKLDRRARFATTTAAHFSYGGAAGALYPYASRALPGPTLVKGALFGLGLWAGGYLGWVPAAGVLRSAARESSGRNAMMILTHVIWGVATALTAETLIERGRQRALRRGDGRADREGEASEHRDAESQEAPLDNSRRGFGA